MPNVDDDNLVAISTLQNDCRYASDVSYTDSAAVVKYLNTIYRPSPIMTTDQVNLEKITNSSRPKYSCSNENTNLLG